VASYSEILTQKQLEDVFALSYQKPVLILKHSTQCPISARAFRNFCNFCDVNSHDKLDTCLIKVIESKALSQIITKTLGIEHKSPQVILIRNGKVIWHASHYDINEDNIMHALTKLNMA
jgi:bacillithiol system protein YtxJ